MKSKFIKFSIWTIVMLAVITKALGLSRPPEKAQLMPRQIELSGNLLNFSIPENFSTDMPADNMIESVNLSDKSIYKDHEKFTLIRRWWDFKESGIFAKEFGTIMMSIYIKETPDNSDKNILTTLGLIGTTIDSFNLESKTGEEKDSEGNVVTLYPNFYEAYSMAKFNQQNWVSYPIEHPSLHQHEIYYAIPVTDKNYIVVSFSFAPVNSIPVREFIDQYGREHMKSIMNSFNVKYVNNSSVPAVIEQAVDLQKLIKDKFY